MDLQIVSLHLRDIPDGVVLDITAGDLQVQAYLVIAPADLEMVSRIVPTEIFEQRIPVHVSSVDTMSDVTEQVVQILENMQPGDVVVYLCADLTSYAQALKVLGWQHSHG